MAETFEIEIVTPEKLVVRDMAEEMQIPAKRGYLGILPGHSPLITELSIGEIMYRNSGTTVRISVAWGFAEVLPYKVTILAEAAERAEDIDLKRAEEAKARAEERLESGHSDIDFERAINALRRAETRVQVAQSIVSK